MNEEWLCPILFCKAKGVIVNIVANKSACIIWGNHLITLLCQCSCNLLNRNWSLREIEAKKTLMMDKSEEKRFHHKEIMKSFLPLVLVIFHHQQEKWVLSAEEKQRKWMLGKWWRKNCSQERKFVGMSNLRFPPHFIRTSKSSFIDSLLLNCESCCTTVNTKVNLQIRTLLEKKRHVVNKCQRRQVYLHQRRVLWIIPLIPDLV